MPRTRRAYLPLPVPRRKVVAMDLGGCRETAAELNERIRRFVAGRTHWSPEALAELDRLRAAWREAVRRELTTAA